jgi:signal transduction histidine kinase
MKSLGGEIKINSSEAGTEVSLSFPYSFDDEEEE